MSDNPAWDGFRTAVDRLRRTATRLNSIDTAGTTVGAFLTASALLDIADALLFLEGLLEEPTTPADRRSIAHQATRLIGEKIPTGREFHRPERPDPLSAWTDSAVDAERRRIWALIEKHPDRRAFAQAAGIWLELTAIKHVIFEGDEP